MRVETPCPTERDLYQFLLGFCEEGRVVAFEEHVARCERCGARAEELQVEDGLVAAMRERSPILTGVDSAAVDTLVELFQQRQYRAPKSSQPLGPAEAPGELGRLGAYRILRVLGEGGMGLVYLARHDQLSRLVALKVVSVGPGSGTLRLARFRREAEILARLRHPNVVQLYEVGEWGAPEGGSPVPYFAMEYVEGGTLAEKLAGNPLEPRLAAQWLESLARGAQAAHEQGVVHRDLKPANVLLLQSPTVREGATPTTGALPHGRALEAIPKITDFGLARCLDDDGMTRTGAILGTPAYMAPDQAVGQEPSPAADLYSLGAIFYEMLTGHPPFRGATAMETLEQARNQEPVEPRSLRPGIPRDLSVICLKCLEKDPSRRYRSAQALADDLRRHLDGRPIVARPASVAVRVVKWARRRPLVASLSAACLASLAALLVGGVIYEGRLRDALNQAREEGERAEEQSREAVRHADRADANYRGASDAVRRMLIRTLDPRWNAVPRLHQLRRQQIEDALAFYEGIARQQGENPQVRHDVAWASLEAGKAHLILGRLPEARASIRRAADLTEALMRERPDDVKLRLLRADVLLKLGIDTGDSSGLRGQEQGVAVLEGLIAEVPDAPGVRAQLADSHITLSATYHARREYAKALRVTLRAVELSSALLDEAPADDGRRKRLARARINLAATYRQLPRPDRLRAPNDLAESDLEQLLARDPYDRESIDGLAVLRINGAYDLQAAGNAAAATAYVQRNVPMLEAALKREPDDAGFRLRLYGTHGVTATMLQAQGKVREAALAYEQVIRYANEANRTVSRLSLADIWLTANEYPRAAVELDEALEELTRRPDANSWRWLAERYDKIAGAAAGDVTLTSERRQELAKRYRAAAEAARRKTGAAEKRNSEDRKP